MLESVRAGRVAHTSFLDPDDAASLVAALRQAEAGVHVSGGFPGARRRVVTAFPETIPEATTALKAVYAEGAFEPDELRVGLLKEIPEGNLGDIISHQAGLSFVTFAKTKVSETVKVQGRGLALQEVDMDHVASGSLKRQLVIVPSLRADALGAKAFGVSRSYFAKGIKAGNVTINGERVGKSGNAEAGDELYAEGLGRMFIVSVQGETRKGNLKVMIEIEKA